MPYLPTVDYSPLSSAIGLKGAAGQANFSERFKALQKKEEKRQEIVGTIQGALQVASSVYGFMEQSKEQQGKRKLVDYQTSFNTALLESIDSGETKIETRDGQNFYVLSPALEQMQESMLSSIDDEYKGFGRVAEGLKAQAATIYGQARGTADSYLFKKSLAEGEANYQANLSDALKLAVDLEDVDALRDVIWNNRMLSEAGKEADWSSAQKAYGLGLAEKNAVAASRAGGIGAGYSSIDATGFTEAEKASLRQSVDRSVKADTTTATETAAQVYEQSKTSSRFVPDTAIKDISKRYPEWMRPDVESALRKQQTFDNVQKYTEQFNGDRDVADLAYLKGQYERVQASADFNGDEATRSMVMGWYEGLIGSKSAGSDKKEEEAALRLGEAIVSNFQNGFTKGPEALRSIEELMNGNQITGPQAKGFKERITAYQFPQAKPFLDKSDEFAMSALGIKKKAFKDLPPEEQTRVSTLAASYSSFLSDKLFEGGGSVTPEQLAKYQNEALTALTAKAFEDMRVGWSLFKSRDTMTEAAVAKTLAAYDSPAGRTAVFQDSRTGQIQYLSDEPEKMRETVNELADYGRSRLEARGVQIVGEMLEREGDYDVTGITIYTGSDGMQYRMIAEGDKVKLLTRGSSSAAWRPAAPSAAEEQAAADQARKAEEDKLAAAVQAASQAYQGFITKRDTTSAGSLAAKKKFDEANAALKAFRAKGVQQETIRYRRLAK